MKTKNNVLKTILKLLVVLSCLIFGNKSAYSQRLWGPMWSISNTDNITVALLKTKTSSENSEVKSSYHPSIIAEYSVIEEESPLELEEWMINDYVFEAETNYSERDRKSFHEMESWIRRENFDKEIDAKQEKIKDFYLPEKEPELELEPWMIDSDLWK